MAVAVVAAVVVAQRLARAIAHLLAPGMSTGGVLLLETLAVGIVLGIAAFRLVYRPLSRRPITAPVTAAPCEASPGEASPGEASPGKAIRHRHLVLVD